MLIRSTRQACFVILANGLTLELFYADSLIGSRCDDMPADPQQPSTPSQGVWLLGESVVSEVLAGQA